MPEPAASGPGPVARPRPRDGPPGFPSARARVQRFLMLYVVGPGPEPVARRIDLRPGKVLGGATFRYRCEGSGLIQLDLGPVVDAGSDLRRSHTNHSTEKRALKWTEVTPDAGDPGQWDWTLVTRTSSKLNRPIRGMAVRKIGPWPVLPTVCTAHRGGMLLLADRGFSAWTCGKPRP